MHVGKDFLFFLFHNIMFKRVNAGILYKEWLETAHLIDPQYNYFSFAQLCNENKSTTNTYYMTLMNKIVKENPGNRGAITALNQFLVNI